jgi:hypothetical protein
MILYSFPEASSLAAAELSGLLASGLGADHAALLLEVVAAERAPESSIDLVTSGPAAGGTRDTGVVLRRLFASAERRCWSSGSPFTKGARFSVSSPSACGSCRTSPSECVSTSGATLATRPAPTPC